MSTLKKIALTITATLCLGFTPISQATDDLERLQTFLTIMIDYMHIVEANHSIQSDPEKAAIMQMSKIKEIYEDRGENAQASAVLQEVLAASRNQTIRNAAYQLLGDNLKETGRSDEAIKLMREALQENIKAAP